jgi:hypothetical protein
MFEGSAPLNTAGLGSQICHGNFDEGWLCMEGRGLLHQPVAESVIAEERHDTDVAAETL